MADWPVGKHTSFISLPTAVFCVQCELIGDNHTSRCFACGSSALLSLSRLLGGSLLGQATARLIADAELDRLVRELLGTVPQMQLSESSHLEPQLEGSAFLVPPRHHARSGVAYSRIGELEPGEVALEPAINVIAERAQVLTRATGAAIALRRGDDIVCRARTGRTAPDLGVRLQTGNGISGECVRTGEVVLCNDSETNSSVDSVICKRLGARSILAAPLRYFRRTLGVFEVLSANPFAFDHSDVATMQLLSSLLVTAMSRLSKPAQPSSPVS